MWNNYDGGMMRHSASVPAVWTAPGEVWEFVSQLVSSYHEQHNCQVIMQSYSFSQQGDVRRPPPRPTEELKKENLRSHVQQWLSCV